MKDILKKITKGILVFLGFIFVSLGVIGIFVPLLPTTVFLLLSAFCFARSSDKFYTWLLNNKWFGDYIKNYREKKGVPIRVKLLSIILLWSTILYSLIFLIGNIYLGISLLVIAISVTIHLVTLKTCKLEKGPDKQN